MAIPAGQMENVASQEVNGIAESIIEQLKTIFDPRIIDQRITLGDVKEQLILHTELQALNPQEVFVSCFI